MYEKKNNLLLLGLLLTVCTYGQVGKEKIKESFDTIFYNSDSSSFSAYHLRKGIYHGYAIVYDKTGKILVGKYKKGKPDGVWLCNNPECFITYKNGIASEFYAPWDYAGDRKQAEQNFWTLYWKAINTGKTNKK